MSGCKFLGAAAIGAALALSSATGAMALPSEINVAYQTNGNVFGAVGDRWFEEVKATLSIGSKTYNRHVYAGRFQLKSDAPADSFLAAFDAFCVDFIGTLTNPPGKYEVNGPVFADGAGGADATQARVAGFWNANYGKVADSTTAAAFQIGLWEVKYDATFGLKTGAFKVTSASATALSLVNGWLGDFQTLLDDGAADATPSFITLNSAGGQDLLTPVPLPAGAALLLTAIGGLGLAARRRRAA